MQKYQTQQGDTWDLIAYRVYDNEFLIPPLLEANSMHREVVVFSAGVWLDVPELADGVRWASDAPPWRDVE